MAGPAIVVDFLADTSRLSRAIKDVNGQSSSLASKFGKLAKAGAIGVGVGLGVAAVAINKTIDAASDLNESVNAVTVTFGKAHKRVLDFSKKAVKEAGLSMREFNELVTPIGAGLQNMGYSADQAATASINLAKRAADMASVFNTSVPEAMQAIQAGLRGEADPLERFGVGMKESAVQAKAMAMGLATSTKALTEQDKAQARVALLMEQTNKFAGDFKNTSGGYANAVKMFGAAWENAQAQIGEKFLPVAARFVTWAANELPGAIDKAMKFINRLTTAEGFSAKLKIVWEGIAEIGADLITKIKEQLRTMFIGQDVFSVQEKAMIHIDPTVQINWGGIREQFKAGFMSALASDSASQELGDKLMAGLQRVGERLLEWAKSQPGKVVRDVKAAFNTADIGADLDKFILGPLRAAIGVIQGNANRIVSVIKAIVNPVGTAANLIGDKIVSGITSPLGGLVGKVTGKVQALWGFLKGAAGSAFAYAFRIGSQIVVGVMSGLAGLGEKVTRFIGSQLAKIKNVDIPGLSPPEHAAAKAIGEPLGRGVIAGWIKSTATLPETMSKSIRVAIEAARKTVEAAEGRLVASGASLADRLKTAFSAAQGAVQTESEKIIAATEAAHAAQARQQAVWDAEKAVQAATSAEELARAQIQLRDAIWAIDKVALEEKAKQERTALNAAQTTQQTAFNQAIKNLEKYLGSGEATAEGTRKRINALMTQFGLDFATIGELLGTSFAAGIEKNTGAVVAAAGELARKAKKAVQDVLGMASPSKVMIDAGRNFSLGFAQGISSATGVAVGAATRLGAATATAGGGMSLGSPSQPLEVRVFIGDTELKGLVRSQIVDANTGIARTLLAGARG